MIAGLRRRLWSSQILKTEVAMVLTGMLTAQQ